MEYQLRLSRDTGFHVAYPDWSTHAEVGVRSFIYRLSFLMTASLFTAAFFADAHDVTFHDGDQFNTVIHGYFLAGTGWLGPLELCFAWYANVPFLFCAFRLAIGRSPGRRWAWIATGLALSVFVPQLIWDFEHNRILVHYFYGPAVWLWFISFPIILGTVYAFGEEDSWE